MTPEERMTQLTREIEALHRRIETLEAERPSTSDPARRPALHRSARGRSWLAAFAGVLLAPLVAWAVDVPFTFVNGTLADASQVNANFVALEAAFNDHIGDPNLHHPPLTSIDGLAGGTLTGDLTVTGIVHVDEVAGTPLRLTSPSTITVTSGSTTQVNASATLDLNGALITLN